MGGLISNLLSKGAQQAGQKLESGVLKSEGSAVGRELHEFFGNQELELNATPEGKIIKSYIEEGHRLEVGHLKQLNQPYEALWSGIKADPALASRFDYSATDLKTIHQDLSASGHPLAQYSGQLIGQNAQTIGKVTRYPNNDKTLAQLAYQNKRQASLLGAKQAMGANFENISPLIMKLRESPSTTLREMGQRYADIVSNEFRDKDKDVAFSTKGAVKGEVSKIKQGLNKSFSFVNKLRKGSEQDGIPLLDTKPTYSDSGQAERWLSNALRTVQAPLAILPHSSMEANVWLRSPVQAVVKAFAGVDKQTSDKLIEASNILTRTDLDFLHQDIVARTGKIAKWTGSPTVASILDKTFHMPLFNDLRKMQVRHAGSVGFHSANYWAGKLMQGSRMAEAELKEMHIDPAAVRAQGGTLTEEQLTKGIYHYVNDTMFLSGGLKMPLGANKNFFLRSMYMYHYYVRNQALFLQKTFTRMAQAGDMAGIARYIGVLGVLWPNVAPLLNGLEVLGRTASPSQAGAAIGDDYRKLYAPENTGEWMANYFGLLAHIGAIGTFMQYANFIKYNTPAKAMAGQIMGPMISTPAVMLGDALNAAGGRGAKPLGRDMLQLVPLVGKPLSHQLLPTIAEGAPKTNHRGIRRRRR
jgi:hypothetical protein